MRKIDENPSLSVRVDSTRSDIIYGRAHIYTRAHGGGGAHSIHVFIPVHGPLVILWMNRLTGILCGSSTRSQNTIKESSREKKNDDEKESLCYCNSNRIRWQFFRMTNTGVIDWALDPPTQRRTAARYITAILLTTIINTVQWFFCQFFFSFYATPRCSTLCVQSIL